MSAIKTASATVMPAIERRDGLCGESPNPPDTVGFPEEVESPGLLLAAWVDMSSPEV